MIEVAKIISGLITGYLIISITVSLSHKNILHATKQRVISWQKFGCLGRYIYASWYSHYIIHHYKTFKKNYVTQFNSIAEKEKLKQWLIENNKEQIIHDGYGVRVGGFYQKIQYTYTHLLQLLLICYLGGIWFSTGVAIILVVYVLMAENVHPYLHQSDSESLEKASLLMRIFLNSYYFKFLAQHQTKSPVIKIRSGF